MVSRLAVFSHFDVDDIIDDYVMYYLRELRDVVTDISFVSTSDLAPREREKIADLCTVTICRDNVGYDFMSYKAGLLDPSLDYRKYDEVLICNDSVYGPFHDLKRVFESMESRNCDFWGMTVNNEIQKHVQSYFVVFRKKIVQSAVFFDFFNSVSVLPAKQDIIMRYEIGLTAFLAQNKFTYCGFSRPPDLFRQFAIYRSYLHNKEFLLNDKYPRAYALLRKTARITRNYLRYLWKIVIRRKINLTHYDWESLIASGNPFVKIELLRTNPRNLEDSDGILRVLNAYSDYPTVLIDRHLARTRKKY